MAVRRLMQKRVGDGSFSGLKFYKEPKEIQKQAAQNIHDLEFDIEDARVRAEKLCKKHDLDFVEVFEEEIQRLGNRIYENAAGHEVAYVTKATSSVAPTKANQNLLQQIQEDMNQLGNYARQIIAFKDEIKNFQRISNHIANEHNTAQELTYSELVELGFD
jgi:hypothetical protein